MSTGGQELFVVCKSCGSEVSPYITECPYCGNRLRKRAPKLDRNGDPVRRRPRRSPPPLLSRLRRDEIPGIRPETRPYATLVLVAAGLVGTLLWRTSLGSGNDLAVHAKLGSGWWHVFTAAFTYDNTGYAVVTLGTIGLFGWLLERRHGPLAVLGLFLLGGLGGLAATAALYPAPFALGALGAAVALLVAWALPDLLALRRGQDVEGDLLGVGAIAVVVLMMPLAAYGASWIADGVGVAVGLVIGLPLARMTVR
ncbi:MAG: rhomboid family intramembrane serine protease [Actinomycetota bacterium]|nr:rhomboid family intramembrane serine protease [Actinomycetota bacterium]